jgi:alpha-beta hydrolase superfamily lysophospholipase
LFPIPLNEPDLFTASEEWQRYIDGEPHGLREATARFLFASFALDVYLRRAAKRVRVPTLLMLAGRDRIIDNAKTRAFLAKFRAVTTIIDYPGAHHTLEFEPDGHPWLGDLRRWVERRVGG